jgi:DNA polymerase-3 subunit delta'
MNVNAANSLLKTLEEPRENTLIILLAHNAKNLPVTVVSRCQSVHISPAYDQETQIWIKENIEYKEDFDVAQLLEAAHGVPFKVIEDLSGDGFIHYQHWQDQLLKIALHPTTINKVEDFENNEVSVLNCLQHLIVEGIRLKSLKQKGGLIELNQIINMTKIDFLFKLLHDIQHAISLSKTSVNIKLLLDNVLIIWSHITHLKTYPKILN